MKHLFTLLSFYLLSTHFGAAQNWALPSSRWAYAWSFCGGPVPCSTQGYYNLRVEKDTVVATFNCRKIIGYGSPLYTYDSGDTAYLYQGSAFHPLFYFSAHTGDTLLLYNDTSIRHASYQPTDIYAHVDSVVLETYQNLSLKRFYIHTIDDPAHGVYSKQIDYRERVGLNHSSDSPFYPVLVDATVDVDQYVCDYADSTVTNYWLSISSDCDRHVGLIEPSSQASFTLSPNPANDYIEINTELRDYKVQISDMTGRKYDCAIKENTIDIRMLADGVYMLLLSADGVSVTKRFVKQ
jgi:hypothetical protein